MATQRTFAQRIGYQRPCVALATILSGDHLLDEQGQPTLPSLREEASRDGLCYLRVQRYLAHADLYQAQVAPTFEALLDQPLSIFLTEQQLYTAFPYDCRTGRTHGERAAQKSPEQVGALLRAHALQMQPALQRAVPAPVEPVALLPQEAYGQPVEITAQELQEAMGESATMIAAGAPMASPRLQQALLAALLDAMMHRLYQGVEHVHALLLKARCLLLIGLQRWQKHTGQQAIEIVPHIDEQQRSFWRVLLVPGAFQVKG